MPLESFFGTISKFLDGLNEAIAVNRKAKSTNEKSLESAKKASTHSNPLGLQDVNSKIVTDNLKDVLKMPSSSKLKLKLKRRRSKLYIIFVESTLPSSTNLL